MLLYLKDFLDIHVATYPHRIAVESIMDRLKTLEILKAVADHGSFTKAAELHRLSVAHVSRAVQCLEMSLGVLIFHRTTRKVTLTHAGSEVIEQANALLRQYECFSASCHSNANEIQGDISIEASNLFGADRLIAVLADFSRQYPLVQLRIDWIDHPRGTISGTTDLSIVTERTSISSCIERPLGRIPMGIYASPGFLAACGMPDDPKALEQFDLQCGRSGAGMPVWSLQHRHTGAAAEIRLANAIRSNSIDTLILAATRGTGFAVLPEHLARPHEHRGDLLRILPDWQVADLKASLLYHSRRNLPARIRKLTEHLVTAFQDCPARRPAARQAPRPFAPGPATSAPASFSSPARDAP
jgi:DNA-binding transcriptional LysR family regulator